VWSRGPCLAGWGHPAHTRSDLFAPMSVELHLNGQVCEAEKGHSLFTHAEKLGVPVPTSCNKNGKCKECVVEVTEGMDCLSKPGPEERHLKGSFRLSCCSRIAAEE